MKKIVIGYLLMGPEGKPIRGPGLDGKPGRVLLFTTEDRAREAAIRGKLSLDYRPEPVIRGMP